MQLDKKINRLFHICLMVAFATSCTTKKVPLRYPDPFKDFFKGKGILFVAALNKDSTSRADSIFFDRRGSIIRARGLGQGAMYLYDSNNFILRKMTIVDKYAHYIFSYDVHNDYVRQVGREIESIGWEFTEDKINRSDSIEFRHELNEKGQIVSTLNGSGIQVDKFTYDHFGRLIEKLSTYDQEKKVEDKINYFYYGDADKLVRIECTGLKNYTQYFSNGLLDSTVYTGNEIAIYKYSYY